MSLGWGATEFSLGDEQSEFLVQIDVTVHSTSSRYILETNVGPTGADPCSGDSGGPLLLRGDDLEWTLVGTLIGGGYDCVTQNDTDLTSNWNKVWHWLLGGNNLILKNSFQIKDGSLK